MRTLVFSLLMLLLLLLPLTIVSSSPDPEAAEGQKERNLPAKRHHRGRRQECRCEDVFQNSPGGKRLRVPKQPTRQCPCDHLKHKQKKSGSGHQRHARQRCFRFLKQCQQRHILLPLSGPL
ncbi:C-X-C motif chemokine 17 [Gracilinanus agilis]|uniref:C-X-C motif chemokine 17 n=1 Tax=Gracilinanus agilis TaxID=191870 RepID=UPI001CFF18D6|nr:C-X-C motif chemokine 17 [Gracilinanus agilis]